MGDRSGVTGGALGSEARSTTSHGQYTYTYDDDRDRDGDRGSGGGLPPIPEGDVGGPASQNATASEGAAAEVAPKAAEVPRLSPDRSLLSAMADSQCHANIVCCENLGYVQNR